MGDYSKQTWTDDDGSGTTGTLFSKARMDAIEQGIFDATKQALLVPGTVMDGGAAGGTRDKQRVVWTRSSDGSYMASIEGYESGSGATQVTTVYDRVDGGITTGALVQRILEARQRGGAPIVTGLARVKVESTRGGRQKVYIETKSESGFDPTFSLKLLDDLGASDIWPAMVTSLPTTGPGGLGSVVDGQECHYLADSAGTNGGPVVWHLKFRASDSKWYYLGGPPLYTQVNTGLETVAATSGGPPQVYTDPTTVGPSITVPLAGDYALEYGASSDCAAPDGSGQSLMVVRTAGTGGSTANSSFTSQVSWRSVNFNNGSRVDRATVAAGYALKCMYGNNNAASRVSGRWLRVIPIKVS